MSECTECGAQNEPGASFCVSCGAFVNWDTPSGLSVADRSMSATEFRRIEAQRQVDAEAHAQAEREAAAEAHAQAEREAQAEAHAQAEAQAHAEREAAAEAHAQAEREAQAQREAQAEALAEREAEREAEALRQADAEREAEARTQAGREADADAQRQAAVQRLIARSPVLPGHIEPSTAPVHTSASEPSPSVRSRVPSADAAAKTSLASIIQIAERTGRTDLASRIETSTEQLKRTDVEVWVVGEHKKGKSNLVNALVNADVCPVDPVWATVVPIRITAADELAVATVGIDGEITDATLDDLLDEATEFGNAHNHRRLRRVDVALPRRLLLSGITFVDAPGIGGLESAVGSVTLASIAAADGAIYVTECSQEMTSTELSYLGALHERCGRAICVMTKRDLYLDVEPLVARNRAHLDAQGLNDVPLVAVSSYLHLLALAEQDEALEAESEFGALFDVIHEHLWVPTRRTQVAAAARDLNEVATHLALPIAAELGTPGAERADRAQRLEELQARLLHLQSDSAGWQQRLNDGFHDLLGDADHELRERLRTLTRLAEARVEAAGNEDDLVFEAWLRKAAIDSVAEHYSRITERASGLAEEVGGRLRSFDRSDDFRPVAQAPDEQLGGLYISRGGPRTKDGVLRRVVSTGQGYTSGIVLTSSVLGVGALIVPSMVTGLFPFLALPIAGLMAKSTFGDDRDRRALARRAELKRTATKYLEEVGFIVQKDARDVVKRLHRDTRTHFTQRTQQLHTTISQTIQALRRSEADEAGSDPESARERADELCQSRDAVAGLQATARRLVHAADRGAA